MTDEQLADLIDQCAAISLIGSDGIKGYLPVGSPKIISAALRAGTRPAPTEAVEHEEEMVVPKEFNDANISAARRFMAERDHWYALVPRADRIQFPFIDPAEPSPVPSTDHVSDGANVFFKGHQLSIRIISYSEAGGRGEFQSVGDGL